jgi:flagellin FlaB
VKKNRWAITMPGEGRLKACILSGQQWRENMRTLIGKFLKRMRKDQQGITGLETAIILIAFVIVASVFAYVVLSAGLFSSQKVKESVNAGMDATMATVEIRGDIVARMEDRTVTEIYVCLGVNGAGSPVDFTASENGTRPLVITYMDANHLIPSVNWTLTKLTTINNDDLLDPNELFEIIIDMASTGNVTISPYQSFALEIKPPNGPVNHVERTVPGRVSQYVNLR